MDLSSLGVKEKNEPGCPSQKCGLSPWEPKIQDGRRRHFEKNFFYHITKKNFFLKFLGPVNTILALFVCFEVKLALICPLKIFFYIFDQEFSIFENSTTWGVHALEFYKFSGYDSNL